MSVGRRGCVPAGCIDRSAGVARAGAEDKPPPHWSSVTSVPIDELPRFLVQTERLRAVHEDRVAHGGQRANRETSRSVATRVALALLPRRKRDIENEPGRSGLTFVRPLSRRTQLWLASPLSAGGSAADLRRRHKPR